MGGKPILIPFLLFVQTGDVGYATWKSSHVRIRFS
jgi:hypothetical protein